MKHHQKRVHLARQPSWHITWEDQSLELDFGVFLGEDWFFQGEKEKHLEQRLVLLQLVWLP